MRRLVGVSSVCALLSVLFTLSPCHGGTIVVTNTNDSGAGSLRQALADAQENDIVTFQEDVRGMITLDSGELVFDKAVAIQGPGANLLAIQPESSRRSRVLRTVTAGRTVTISGLTLSRGQPPDNLQFADGGCIYNAGDLTLLDCTISAGFAIDRLGREGRGGGIFNATGASITLERCTLAANVARGGGAFSGFQARDGLGGALYNQQGATALVRNCTLSDNKAAGGPGDIGCGNIFCGGNKPPAHAFGGAIANFGDLIVEACTIAGNSAQKGTGGPVIQSQSAGGGIHQAGSARVASSILAKNTTDAGAPDGSGAFGSAGYNLVGNGSGVEGFVAIGDQQGTASAPVDPKLGPLRDNGGSTLTVALLPGSPALDRGSAPPSATDQRGFKRRVDFANVDNGPGGASDIGAFEFQRRGLLNISTRMHVRTGEKVLVAGFIVARGATKELIVRGIGSSLAVESPLRDPTIEIFEEHGVAVAFNDDWRMAETASDIERTLPPSHDSESALWGIINPGTYTTVLRGSGDTTGIGLVETYDLDQAVDSGLVNISSRGFVGTGDDVMIAGIIVGPEATGSTRVVLRAIGPSLAAAGIEEPLRDPLLDVRDSEGNIVAINDDWESDLAAAEIAELQLAPSDSRESATLQILAPGAYTAIVRGNGGGSGVGLVEAYDIGPVDSASTE